MTIWKQWFDSNCDKKSAYKTAIKNSIEGGAVLEHNVAMKWLESKKMYNFSPECEQQINEIYSSNGRQSPLNAIYENIKNSTDQIYEMRQKHQDEDYKERRGHLSRSPAQKILTSSESKKYKKKSAKKKSAKKKSIKKKSPVKMSRTRC
jgi:hypothetical protein